MVDPDGFCMNCDIFEFAECDVLVTRMAGAGTISPPKGTRADEVAAREHRLAGSGCLLASILACVNQQTQHLPERFFLGIERMLPHASR